MAPRFSVAVSSGTTRAGSTRISCPMPPQAGQAPNGLLNENSRGSISGMVKPDNGQAKRCEKVRRGGSGERTRPGRGGAGGGGGGVAPAAPPPPPGGGGGRGGGVRAGGDRRGAS